MVRGTHKLLTLLIVGSALLSPSVARSHAKGLYKTQAAAEQRAVDALRARGHAPQGTARGVILMGRSLSPRLRRLHRLLVPIAAAPLLLTAASGSLYSVLLDQGIDAFWLLNIHTGRFGPINLQPYYSVLLGLFTLVVILSGLSLLISRGNVRPASPRP